MNDISEAAIQDRMNSFGTCFGCGTHNEHGFKIKSHWNGSEAVATWQPQPHHTGGPGMLYGGIIASLIDCHCGAAAIAAAYQAEGREIGSHPLIHYVTAYLNVTYLRPTPVAGPVELRARVTALEGRKALLECTLGVAGRECARAESLFVRIPDVA